MTKKTWEIAGVIFDCDGVMIDSEAANRYFYNKILAALDLPPMTPEQERFAFMATSKEALEKMTDPGVHPRLEELARSAVDYEKEILPRTILMPGFREFIEKSHSLGLRLAIDTNRTDIGIQRILDFFNLPPYFNPVITSSKAPSKPSPEGTLLICQAWGVKPEHALFVGDSEVDKGAAKGAGALFASFGNKDMDGDFKVSGYEELLKDILPFIKHKPN